MRERVPGCCRGLAPLRPLSPALLERTSQPGLPPTVTGTFRTTPLALSTTKTAGLLPVSVSAVIGTTIGPGSAATSTVTIAVMPRRMPSGAASTETRTA